ncbi:GNAT family N-acetyltransferase [Oharaeibacter diazotrophicus]|uniref:Putative acetyltransferase n=1 Tax=Oharaeibacter diazotrophicus TaxID=1920512 RepID=A0A4R6RBX0_9HYPH|nr:N-acetyltransferase [Oharaeibacter diazotrophicus]TDP83544.1 putative acetyltransferase [Oharaeibacter diazotrophicus]BBE72377.1 hypothetical protein OHA_1_01967 [Pleomorphomonas sp. SM30]GLS79148.1 GCN5 family N-acetyltransferase [Oharaeibacter diazotrophicus]
MEIRDERPEDAAAMSRLIADAFSDMPYACGYEAEIVERLRAAGALDVSLVASDEAGLAGQVAVSAVAIDGADRGWSGLGPLAVRRDLRRRGVGSALVRAALDRLLAAGAAGCVLVGDPAYYGRFGFSAGSGLVVAGVPDGHVLALPLSGPPFAGRVTFHPAFDPPPQT